MKQLYDQMELNTEEILFDLQELGQKHDIKGVFVVSGNTYKRTYLPKYFDALGWKVTHFSGFSPNPDYKEVCDGVAQFKASKADIIVAVGGGSAMDVAKAIKLYADLPEGVDYMKEEEKPANVPFLAVPTTAGTGSETTIAAVITDTDTHHKYALMDLHLIPRYAVLDPEMTRGLPPKITAATGMDALTHAVEAYCCWTYNTKESLRDAEEATVAIFKYLKRAYDNGDDMEARNEMLIASYKAGFAFTRAGVGNVHAIAHTLGGLYNTPHGLANAVILPIVLEDYGPAVYKKLARLSELTGTCTSGTEEEKAKAFIKEIRAMNTYFEHPTGFDFIQEKDIPQMIKWALHEANPTYPVPVVYDEERCNKVIHRIINEA